MKKFCLIIIVFLLSGCYDYKGLNDLAIISGIAIDYVDDVEKSLEEKNIQELIAQALEQLSPRQREIFELSRNRGLSHKEIAEQLGLSVYTVQDHIKNALEKIRAYLIPFISACPILVSLIILKYVKP